MFRLDPFHLQVRPARSMRLPRTLAFAGVLAAALVSMLASGCTTPDESFPSTVGSLPGGSPAIAPWQTQPPAPVAEAVRDLSDREGEVVVATAIAAHEMRRP